MVVTWTIQCKVWFTGSFVLTSFVNLLRAFTLSLYIKLKTEFCFQLQCKLSLKYKPAQKYRFLRRGQDEYDCVFSIVRGRTKDETNRLPAACRLFSPPRSLPFWNHVTSAKQSNMLGECRSFCQRLLPLCRLPVPTACAVPRLRRCSMWRCQLCRFLCTHSDLNGNHPRLRRRLSPESLHQLRRQWLRRTFLLFSLLVPNNSLKRSFLAEEATLSFLTLKAPRYLVQKQRFNVKLLRFERAQTRFCQPTRRCLLAVVRYWKLL